MVVVFPLPFGPMKPKILPSGTLRDRSFTAMTSPKLFVTLETSTAAIDIYATPQSDISRRVADHSLRETCRAANHSKHNPLPAGHGRSRLGSGYNGTCAPSVVRNAIPLQRPS